MKKSFFKISLRLLKFVRPLVFKMLFSISAGITGHAAAIGMMSAAALFLCGKVPERLAGTLHLVPSGQVVCRDVSRTPCGSG